MQTNTTRFSDRVEDYVKYRPGYPDRVRVILKEKIGLNSNSIIADIGSGTGISTNMFICHGNKTYAIEPNKEMRSASDVAFAKIENYTSIDGTAEQTHLPKESVDIVFSAQAFHWFNQPKAKKEFKRILKPNGHIVLVWNVRTATTGFQQDYESFLKTIEGYNDVAHRNIDDAEIINFFSPKKMSKELISNFQLLNLDGLKGRLRSSSYFPKSGAESEALMHQLETLFYRYQHNNHIEFEYVTTMYWC